MGALARPGCGADRPVSFCRGAFVDLPPHNILAGVQNFVPVPFSTGTDDLFSFDTGYFTYDNAGEAALLHYPGLWDVVGGIDWAEGGLPAGGVDKASCTYGDEASGFGFSRADSLAPKPYAGQTLAYQWTQTPSVNVYSTLAMPTNADGTLVTPYPVHLGYGHGNATTLGVRFCVLYIISRTLDPTTQDNLYQWL